MELKDIYKDSVCNRKMLVDCYHEISKNKAANTKSVGNETLDSYSNETIDSLRNSLIDQSFKFKPIRKVEIAKFNGGVRILGIPSPRDKVVQKVMAKVLEEIYEKHFLDNSYGFRPRRSTHSAIQHVTGWTGTKWFLEGDISKCFDSIDHHILAELLKQKIESKSFMDLYWKAVRAHYINPLKKTDEFSMIGIPQGSVISPLLSNVYLHELDKFMEKKIQKSKNSGPTGIPNPEYKKIHTKISNLRQYFSANYRRNRSLNKEQEKERLNEILSLEKVRAKLNSTIRGKGYRVYYVRYADDFLVGINGSQRLALELKEEIHEFLLKRLKLTLNLEKTKVTRSDEGILFLGAFIKRYTSRTDDQPRRKNSNTSTGRKVRARIPQGNIRALAPIENITKRLESQGICKVRHFRKRDVIPTRKTAWVNLELGAIVNKYNEVWLGLLRYYSFSYNRPQLNFIQFLLQHSLACTVMNKMKLNSRRQVFKEYGSAISVKSGDKTISFKLEKKLPRINKFSNIPVQKNPFRIFEISLRTKENLLDKPCSICGSTENVEMHHRRPLRAHKTDNTLKGINVNLSRKQIPVCRSCHIRIHAGTYDGPGIYGYSKKKKQ